MKRSMLIPALLLLAASGLKAATEQVDLVVYSGTPCGVAASVMAARQGAKVILVEPTSPQRSSARPQSILS